MRIGTMSIIENSESKIYMYNTGNLREGYQETYWLIIC